MLGGTTHERLACSSGLEIGHDLILSKSLGIEATAIIASEKRVELLAIGLSTGFLDICGDFLHAPGISVTAMHDSTEGGVATGLCELAAASDVGLEIAGDALPIATATQRLCSEYDLDPLGVISSSALLIGCTAHITTAILSALRVADIAVTHIGSIRETSFGLQLRRDDQHMPLPVFPADEITHLFT